MDTKNEKDKEMIGNGVLDIDMISLAEEIINGRRITRDDELSVFLECDLKSL